MEEMDMEEMGMSEMDAEGLENADFTDADIEMVYKAFNTISAGTEGISMEDFDKLGSSFSKLEAMKKMGEDF